MTLEEVAENLDIDLATCIGRFAGNRALYVKFLRKFVDDLSMNQLKSALEHRDEEEIEKAAHALKGVCANLGITRLTGLSHQIVQGIRKGEPWEEIPAQCIKEYERTCDVIRSLHES